MYNMNLLTAGAQGFLSYLEVGGGTRLSPKKWPFFKSGGTKGGTELSFPKKTRRYRLQKPYIKTIYSRSSIHRASIYCVPRYTVHGIVPQNTVFCRLPRYTDIPCTSKHGISRIAYIIIATTNLMNKIHILMLFY